MNKWIKRDKRIKKTQDPHTLFSQDLDKSVAAQKTLLQQVQDLENEGREIHDFMAEEKNALAECLREAEAEVIIALVVTVVWKMCIMCSQ